MKIRSIFHLIFLENKSNFKLGLKKKKNENVLLYLELIQLRLKTY